MLRRRERHPRDDYPLVYCRRTVCACAAAASLRHAERLTSQPAPPRGRSAPAPPKAPTSAAYPSAWSERTVTESWLPSALLAGLIGRAGHAGHGQQDSSLFEHVCQRRALLRKPLIVLSRVGAARRDAGIFVITGRLGIEF